MTTQAEQLAEAHLEAYETRQLAARAWVNTAESGASAERLRRASDAEAPSGATIVWMMLFLAGMVFFAGGYLALGPMLARWFARH